jgi:tyrosine aminotransferase
LLPNPGFSLYKTLCDAKGIAIKTYDLLPEKNWEADPAQIESLIDEHTACILINNPSNPCGSVFSRAFLEQILAVAERNFVPIIADEIYEYMAFEEGAYIPLASLTTEVPILQVSGLSKRYMAPGWRIGWVAIHDRHGRFEHVRSGLYDYATMILGPNALLQACIPSLMNDTPAAYYERNLRLLHDNAKYCQKRALQIKGLKPVTPQGAMYTMVGIDRSILKIENDVEFCRLLFTEESVHLLPGSCFGSGGVDFFRVVICPPIEQLEVAWDRIAQFCERYAIAH